MIPLTYDLVNDYIISYLFLWNYFSLFLIEIYARKAFFSEEYSMESWFKGFVWQLFPIAKTDVYYFNIWRYARNVHRSVYRDEWTCAIGSEKRTEILTAENCFRRIMDKKKGNAGKKRSPNSDEGNGSSFDSDSSSCGTNGNNLVFYITFIFPCSWRAVKSIFCIGPRHYFETWMIENSRKNEKL